MEFYIQIGNPKISKDLLLSDKISQIDDEINILSEVCPYPNEKIILFYNDLCFQVDYDETNSIRSFIYLISEILSSPEGENSIAWGQQEDTKTWNVEWDEETVSINAVWYSGHSHLSEAFNSYYNILTLDKSKFLSEWKMLVEQAITIIDKFKPCFTIEDADSYYTNALRDINKSIKTYGFLYSYKNDER